MADRIAVVPGRCLALLLVHSDKAGVADRLHVDADQPGCIGELERTAQTHGDRKPRGLTAVLGIGNIPLRLVSGDISLRLCRVRNIQLGVILDKAG